MDMNTENGRKAGNRIKQASNVLLSDIGKIPPQAVDIEQIVLGAMMLEKNAVSKTPHSARCQQQWTARSQ